MPSTAGAAWRGPPPEYVAIVAVCLALIVTVWFVTLERVEYERVDAVADAERVNANLALAFEEQTRHEIERADQTLLYLKRRYERDGRVIDLSELTEELGVRDAALIPAHLITDAAGNVLDADGKPGAVNVADRDFFAVQQQKANGGLWIAKPFTGRLTGRTVISLSRPITDSHGNFLGVVAVGLDPNYFLASYRKFDIGSNGLIQLVGLDGTVRARRQGDRISFGTGMQDSTLLRLAADAPAGSFTSRGQSDGVPRFQSYRALHDYPLVVSVGTSIDESLAHFRSRELAYYRGAIAATLGILLFGAILALSLRRRHHAARVLAASEELYRAAFEQAAVGVTHCALDGRFLKANAKYSQMLGYSESELKQLRFQEVIHPEDLARAEALRAHIIASNDASPSPVLEHRELRKDGSTIWVSVAVNMVHQANGAPTYFVAMVEDITARRQAEARERAADERYRATFEQAGVGMVHVGMDGAFLKVNRRCCEMLGYPEEELLSRKFADVTHPEDVARSKAMIGSIIGDGGPMEFEKRYVRKNGSTLWAALSTVRVCSVAGEPEYFVTVMQDITERKRAEEQLLEQLDELRRFQKVTVERELRMLELEAHIRALREKAAA